MKIRTVHAHQLFDSRGNPTIEAVVELENGALGRGLVPSGASTGSHEALELRDGDPRRFLGRSVFRAIENVQRDIAPAVIGRDADDQEGLDAALVALAGTPRKTRLGANALLGVSMAVAQAVATARRVPLFASLGGGRGRLLPLPEIQIFGGGRHTGGRIDVQDFMIVPRNARSFAETLEVAFAVHHAAGRVMKRRGLLAGVADEGGYWPAFARNEDVFAALLEAIEEAGYAPGRDVGLSLDLAATELFRDAHYELRRDGRRYTSEQFAELVVSWIEKYPIVSVEDPLAEDDWDGWQRLRRAVGQRCQLVGDDLFATDLARIERGIAEGSANAVLIKLNQAGTVTETIRAIWRTQQAGWRPIVSARSGETEDSFIAHLAVATDAGQIKVGALCRGERTAKWNELLRIARHLGAEAEFRGASIFAEPGRRGAPAPA